MPVYAIDGITPVVHPSAYIHPSAELIGDVIIGPNCYIGPCACLRGDFGRIIVERGANIQDTCVMHSFPDKDAVVEQHGHIGHGAVLHGCRIGRNALVGMNAVVMDGAEIGEESIIAAGAFVKAAFKCEPRSMVVGSPAKVIKQVSDEQIKWKTQGTAEYQQLALRCKQSLQEVEPLAEVEPDRRRLGIGDIKPLFEGVSKNED
ncbi:MAG: phenylacetic acid degradation protein PaaY [Porticoccaceae bacterium]|nr:phenylacetic acid degradation protein PaaY [Porticoccaceae bacterium]